VNLLRVAVDGVGLLGPGIDDWEEGRAQLAGRAPRAEPTRVPPPEALPAAERRRSGLATRTALAAGQQALKAAGVAASELATVFTSSGGDGVNCHEICSTLAGSDRSISPTRFHNSVHNAPSGYWSIATGSMAPSSVLCAHDGSFGAGLLEAMTQVATERRRVLLIAYDTRYPEPLFAIRPIPDAFGVALLLSPEPGAGSLGTLALMPRESLTGAPPDRLAAPALEDLRLSIPAARCLPLLAALAAGPARTVTLDYLDGLQLSVQVAPC
jgi:hypothetical protein